MLFLAPFLFAVADVVTPPEQPVPPIRLTPFPPGPLPSPPPPPVRPVDPPRKPAEMVNLGTIFTESNYPFWAMRNAEEGVVRFRVAIDPAGRTTACEITLAAESQSLNEGTCDLLLTQARFTPARDRRGRPVASVYSRQVRWQLENREPFAVANGHERVVIRFGAAGVEDCRIEGTPGREIDQRACQHFIDTPKVAELAALSRQAGDPEKMTGSELVIEDSDFIDPAAAATVGSQNGERRLDQSRIRLTIDPAGAVIGCELVETGQNSEAAMRTACERTAKCLFEPAAGAANRHLTMVSAVYLRPRG